MRRRPAAREMQPDASRSVLPEALRSARAGSTDKFRKKLPRSGSAAFHRDQTARSALSDIRALKAPRRHGRNYGATGHSEFVSLSKDRYPHRSTRSHAPAWERLTDAPASRLKGPSRVAVCGKTGLVAKSAGYLSYWSYSSHWFRSFRVAF